MLGFSPTCVPSKIRLLDRLYKHYVPKQSTDNKNSPSHRIEDDGSRFVQILWDEHFAGGSVEPRHLDAVRPRVRPVHVPRDPVHRDPVRIIHLSRHDRLFTWNKDRHIIDFNISIGNISINTCVGVLVSADVWGHKYLFWAWLCSRESLSGWPIGGLEWCIGHLDNFRSRYHESYL